MTQVVLFACVHNAGRSQMAAALFNRYADPSKARAISAGTEPGNRVHPEVVQVMRELGVDLALRQPQRLTDELAQTASMLVTMGCGEACPVVPGVARADWPLEDPKGKPLPRVRAIRSEVAARVRELLVARGWLPWSVRGARPGDRTRVEQLLRAADLPLDGIADHFDAFVVAEDLGAQIAGVVGLELYPPRALLRSLAVDATTKARGLGSLLTHAALKTARDRGVSEVYLRTTTAEGFFAQLGFERVQRAQLPEDLARSAQFNGACPDSAAIMVRRT